MKGLFYNGKHETLKLRGTGDVGNIHVARVSSILKKWNYVEVVHIGTRHGRSHVLEVTVKKAADFNKLYETYKSERAEAREKKRLKHEAKAVEVAEVSEVAEVTEEKDAPHEMP